MIQKDAERGYFQPWILGHRLALLSPGHSVSTGTPSSAPAPLIQRIFNMWNSFMKLIIDWCIRSTENFIFTSASVFFYDASEDSLETSFRLHVKFWSHSWMSISWGNGSLHSFQALPYAFLEDLTMSPSEFQSVGRGKLLQLLLSPGDSPLQEFLSILILNLLVPLIGVPIIWSFRGFWWNGVVFQPICYFVGRASAVSEGNLT